MNNQFAKNVGILRKEKNFTQKQMAEALGVLERTVSYWEQGKRECDFDMLIKISEFFKVGVDDLLTNTEL